MDKSTIIVLTPFTEPPRSHSPSLGLYPRLQRKPGYHLHEETTPLHRNRHSFAVIIMVSLYADYRNWTEPHAE